MNPAISNTQPVQRTTSGAGALDRTRIADRIFRDLRSKIVCGTIPHGSRLPTERELAQHYRVSNPTVREAIRGLSLLGLVDVRHGSGAYVKADVASLIALSIAGVIQLGNLGVGEVLSVLGALNEQAATAAAQVRSPDELLAIRQALAALDGVGSPDEAIAAVRAFHCAVATASHNPLLAALCRFLVNAQVELAAEVTGGSLDVWHEMLARLRPVCIRLVDAISARDPAAVAPLAREFHDSCVAFITSLPQAREVQVRDPTLRGLLSSTMSRIGPT